MPTDPAHPAPFTGDNDNRDYRDRTTPRVPLHNRPVPVPWQLVITDPGPVLAGRGLCTIHQPGTRFTARSWNVRLPAGVVLEYDDDYPVPDDHPTRRAVLDAVDSYRKARGRRPLFPHGDARP